MSQQLSKEAMRVIADATGLSFARGRVQRGDDAAIADVSKTASQLGQDLTRLESGQLTEILEDANARGDVQLRNTVLDSLNALKKSPTTS